MFEWQYQLQKTLQHPRIINYSDAQISGIQRDNKSNSDMVAHGNTTTIRQPTANASGAAIPEHQLQHDTNSRSGSVKANNLEISIVEGPLVQVMRSFIILRPLQSSEATL
jgi:hypothetical protein